MNPREQRGVLIAALCKLSKTGGNWKVPSQSDIKKSYVVNVKAGTCTCPDHAETGSKCKHVYAVEFTMKREHHADGTVTDTKSVTIVQKKTYKQNNTAYYAAQTVEKDRFQELLADLVQGVPEPTRDESRRGRKPHSVANSLFSMVYKVYCGFSGRRFSSDLREAYRRQHLTHSVPGIKANEFMENEAFTPYLKELVVQSARPLRAVETQFSIDSSGFATCRFFKWYDEKYGEPREKAHWIKCHIASGVKTNCVCAIRILDRNAADSPQFIPLVEETAKSFTIKEMSADKAYAGLANFEAVAACGGTLYTDFRSNTTGAVGGLFEKAFHYFSFNKEEYMAHYHRRSNIESTFSAIKRKFGDAVRSKTEIACVNEVICKCVCQNLTALIQEQFELGVDPVFWKPDVTNAIADRVSVQTPIVRTASIEAASEFSMDDFRFSD